jgi:N-acetylglucosaminyldiphosphoundecaprenol N-acetyl-beta-D-mannosaminyltransferase
MYETFPDEGKVMLETPAIPRANVLGIGVHVITVDQAVDACIRLVENNDNGYVCATGAHGVIEAHSDPMLRETLNSSFLNLPDGMPTVWMGKLQGYKFMNCVRGPEFMLALCRVSVHRHFRHFLYGGCDGVVEELANALEIKFPGIQIVGSYTPPFRALTNQEEKALAAQVRGCEPDIMWIGLSTPKQEQFMAKYIHRLNVRLMVGVGAAFDFHSGRAIEAPIWIKDSGLHWLYRLMQEPRRLLSRYGRIVPSFLYLAALQTLQVRKFSLNLAASNILKQRQFISDIN